MQNCAPLLLLPLEQLAERQAELIQHSVQGGLLELAVQVLDYRESGAVIQCAMAPLATLGNPVHCHFLATAQLADSTHKLSALHRFSIGHKCPSVKLRGVASPHPTFTGMTTPKLRLATSTTCAYLVIMRGPE